MAEPKTALGLCEASHLIPLSHVTNRVSDLLFRMSPQKVRLL